MAAILQLRRGTTTPSSSLSELFFNTSTNTLNVGGTNGVITLVKIGSNTGDINLTGKLNINGGISGSSLDITGNAKIDGNIILGGSIFLGDGEFNDQIVVNASLSGSLLPDEDVKYDLGSEDFRYKNLYVLSASIDNVSLPGSGILSSSGENFNEFSESVDSRLDNLQLFTSSQQSINEIYNSYTASTSNRLNQLEFDSGSQAGRLNNLELTSSSHESRLDNLESVSSSYEVKGSGIVSGSSQISYPEISNIPSGIVSGSTQITPLLPSGTVSGSSQVIEILDSLNSYTSSNDITNTTQNSRLDQLSTTSGSVLERLNNLENTSESVDSSLVSLNQYTSSLKTAISVNGSNLTINGDLVVQGTTTQVNSTQVNIGDNILELNYGGSLTQGGLYVKDTFGNLTSGSLLWDSTIDRWIAGPSGSESPILLMGGDNVISGSSQITTSLDSLYLRKDGDSVVSGSSQIDITQTNGYTSFSGSFGDRLTSLETDSGSQENRLNNLELTSGSHGDRITSLEGFSSSQDTINGFYNSYTQSTDGRIDNLEGFTSSIDNIIKNKIDLEGLVSSSTDSSTLSLTIQSGIISGDVIGGVVSGSSQLTQSLDTRYEVSGSVSQLVGIHQISGSLGSAAWYNVSSSISDGNPQVLGNAGAVKAYIDEAFEASGQISEVLAGNGLSGGGGSGSLTLSLDTSSQHFIDGVNESITLFSQSVDSRLDGLESFSSSLDVLFVTEQELAIATGSLINLIDTKLNTGSYLTDSSSFDSRLDSLEGEAHENPLTFDDTNTIKFTRSGDTITSDAIGGIVSGSSQVVLENTTYTDNGDKSFLQTDGSGNLSFQYVDTIWEAFYAGESVPKGTPLYFSGSQGANPIARAADAANPNKMPVVLIAGENITQGNTYEGIVLGLIEGMDLSGYTAGQTVYVAEGGGWTTSLPSGSNSITQVLGVVTKGGSGGKGLVLNPGPAQLPGLQSGYVWIGDDNNRPTIISTGSFADNTSFNQYTQSNNQRVDSLEGFTQSQETYNTDNDIKWNNLGSQSGSFVTESETGSFARVDVDNNFSGTQTFNNIVVNGTGSFSFIQSTTGSSTSIGEAFIILNENTPSSNFAGIKVVDSGSIFATASFVYDGLNNNWVFEHEGSQISGSSLAIFGPLSQGGLGTEIGLTENRIPKAVTDHGHHIGDSNISDNGSLITLNSNSQVNGNLVVNGNVSANNLISGSSQISYPQLSNIPSGIVSGSSQITPLLPSGTVSGSSQVVGILTSLNSFTGSINTTIKGQLNANTVVSGSSQISYPQLSNIPSGIVSGSSQVTPLLPSGTVSGSSQVVGILTSLNSFTGSINTTIKTQLNANTVVSGSSQVTKTLQEVTTAGNTTSTTILITNSTASTNKTSGALVITGGVGIGGDVFAGGDVVAYASSDIRLKNNIQLISNPLQKINQIGGYIFEWNEEKQHIYKGKDYGVIAQEIEEILPELVETRENGYKAVKYEKLVSLLIEGIKDLSKQVDELKKQINRG